MVGLEAFSYNLPVVAYESGGIPEWLEDGKSGFLVERGNISLLSQKIEQLIKNSQMASELGSYGRRRVENDFTLKKHVEVLLDVFEGIRQRHI